MCVCLQLVLQCGQITCVEFGGSAKGTNLVCCKSSTLERSQPASASGGWRSVRTKALTGWEYGCVMCIIYDNILIVVYFEQTLLSKLCYSLNGQKHLVLVVRHACRAPGDITVTTPASQSTLLDWIARYGSKWSWFGCEKMAIAQKSSDDLY